MNAMSRVLRRVYEEHSGSAPPRAHRDHQSIAKKDGDDWLAQL